MHRVSVSASQYVRVDVPQSHSAPRALFRAASAGPWVPGHVVRPAGGSVRYSLGARPTSRACLVRQNQQRHGRPPHGAHLAPPRPATTPGRSMPVLIGHTARPVRRIFPSWQLLPAQLVVSYLRVNARENEVRLVVCGCQLQLRTWWVCLPAAWTAATILWSQTTPSPALAFPRLSRLSSLRRAALLAT